VEHLQRGLPVANLVSRQATLETVLKHGHSDQEPQTMASQHVSEQDVSGQGVSNGPSHGVCEGVSKLSCRHHREKQRETGQGTNQHAYTTSSGVFHYAASPSRPLVDQQGRTLLLPSSKRFTNKPTNSPVETDASCPKGVRSKEAQGPRFLTSSGSDVYCCRTLRTAGCGTRWMARYEVSASQ
jgi:hypothetical protein